jgi:hypothetical protein
VQKKLTAAEGKTLQRITRGLPHLRVLRSIMDEVYRLFDRRCRTATALERLAELRARVRRFNADFHGRKNNQSSDECRDQ